MCIQMLIHVCMWRNDIAVKKSEKKLQMYESTHASHASLFCKTQIDTEMKNCWFGISLCACSRNHVKNETFESWFDGLFPMGLYKDNATPYSPRFRVQNSSHVTVANRQSYRNIKIITCRMPATRFVQFTKNGRATNRECPYTKGARVDETLQISGPVTAS